MTDTRGKIGNRTTRTPQLIAEVKAVVEVDLRVDLSELSAEFYAGLATLHDILHDDLTLTRYFCFPASTTQIYGTKEVKTCFGSNCPRQTRQYSLECVIYLPLPFFN